MSRHKWNSYRRSTLRRNAAGRLIGGHHRGDLDRTYGRRPRPGPLPEDE